MASSRIWLLWRSLRSSQPLQRRSVAHLPEQFRVVARIANSMLWQEHARKVDSENLARAFWCKRFPQITVGDGLANSGDRFPFSHPAICCKAIAA